MTAGRINTAKIDSIHSRGELLDFPVGGRQYVSTRFQPKTFIRRTVHDRHTNHVGGISNIIRGYILSRDLESVSVIAFTRLALGQ